MKTVLLFRHAKSDWTAKYDTDHERPLARRGVKAAKLMGRFLADLDQVPDRVVSSSAVRALATAKLAVAAGDWSCPLQIKEDLYSASPKEVLKRIRRLPDSISSTMLVGHEPTWTGLLADLSGAHVRLPTAALARIDFPVDHWQEVEMGQGMLIWLVPPRVASSAL